MKKLFIFSVATMLMAGAAAAQTTETVVKQDLKSVSKNERQMRKEKKEERKELRKIRSTEASYQSKQQFLVDFPNISAKSWKHTDGFDEATFVQDGKEMNAFYDENFKLVGTTTLKSFADLPAKAQKEIDEKYAGYSKEKVILYDDNEFNETDMILYSQPFADEDSYFIELKNDTKILVLQVSMEGEVSFFKQLN